jgi:hypothetical protein
MAPPRGLLKAMSSELGNLLVVFYGSKGFVRELPSVLLPTADNPARCSWLRKNCSFVRTTMIILFIGIYIIHQFINHRRGS